MDRRLPILEEQHDADDALSRRTFLEYLGATLALAGAGGCKTEAAEKIIPFSHAVPELTPGIPVAYASAMELDGYAVGLLVQTREGRPIKIEGHPEHPISRGAAGPFEQASLMQLYDPERAKGISRRRSVGTWNGFVRAFTSDLGDGDGLFFLMEPTGSPLIESLIQRIRKQQPRAKFFFYSPFAPRGRWEATKALFGRPLLPEHRLDRADVVLSLDADFLTRGPTWLRDANDFATRRRPRPPQAEMSRLYVAECGFSSTGAKADHRLALRSRDLMRFAGSIASKIIPDFQQVETAHAGLAAAIADDLARARSRSLVIAGERQPREVHALAFLLNRALGNVGSTVIYRPDPILEAGEPSHDLTGLAAALSSGAVERLVILGGDPVHTAPAALAFGELIGRAEESAYLGIDPDATAAACDWAIAEAHPLESWGDARAADGTVSLIQPMIRPLFGGRTRSQVLAAFAGEPAADPRALLEQHYGQQLPELLRTGIVPDTTFEVVETTPRERRVAIPSEIPDSGVELAFVPSATLHDGRFAANPWLQELPDPMTRLSWGNAALLAPRTARRLGVGEGSVIRLSAGPFSLAAPVFLLSGLPEESVTLSFGWGKNDVGVNAFALRSQDHVWFVPGVRIEPLSASARSLGLQPVCVQPHSDPHQREIVLSRTLSAYERDPHFAEHHAKDPPSIHPDWPEEGQQWGMAIDLNACVGCNACVVACQAENNVPVVGKINVEKSREMHWLRLDRYYTDDSDNPEVVHQPMLCQHCEKAPCEYVCPVNATVHSPDGLNEMVYNRCIGTRFCSNNCPYKVRRFNWFDFNRDVGRVEELHYNPDVTVRSRGVMEKCTYCVQRIRRAGIAATREGRPLATDEVVTACQQACPAEAIVFGDLNDPGSRVRKLHDDPRTYAVLNELGTRPRTRYLAAIRNKKEDLE